MRPVCLGSAAREPTPPNTHQYNTHQKTTFVLCHRNWHRSRADTKIFTRGQSDFPARVARAGVGVRGGRGGDAGTQLGSAGARRRPTLLSYHSRTLRLPFAPPLLAPCSHCTLYLPRPSLHAPPPARWAGLDSCGQKRMMTGRVRGRWLLAIG